MASRMRTGTNGPAPSRPENDGSSTTRSRFALDLGLREAQDPETVGAKAAALARASSLGLPVLPGFAVTTEAVAHLLARGRLDDAADAEVRRAWASLSDRGSTSLVVRSSSVAEDGTAQSMAGMFT